jgi:arylsulfatase A-like enzyme
VADSALAPPARARRRLEILPGAAWGATLFVAFAFVVEPRAQKASQLVTLLLLALCAALTHGGLFAAAAGAARRAGAWADALLALAAGGLYAFLALSIVKFSVTRSHLRFEDLWFLATSARQAAGEGTGAERGWLLGAALAPLVLAAAFAALLRTLRRRGDGLGVRRGLGLAGVGLSGFLLLVAAVPAGRFAATTLLPGSSALARGLERLLEPRPAWNPDPARQDRLRAAAPAAPPRRWNLLVLMLESVPWKRLYGPDARPGSTPRLDELARESIAFERAYAASTHSDYAQTSILASLYPRKSDAHDYFIRIDYPRTLPWDALGPLGWRSSVHSCQNERWGNMISFLRTPHLGLLRHAPDFPGAPRRGEGSQTKVFEEAVVDAFIDWARAEPGRPFVAYVNFQATHYPYVWPASFTPPYPVAGLDPSTTFLDYPRERVPQMLDRFHNALAYVDRETGRLVDGLAAAGLWESTVLVMVADHGEAFDEHGLVTHGTSLLEEQVRVPLLVRIPGGAPRVVAEPVSALDALPAVYRALGLPRPATVQGRDDVLDPGYAAGDRPLFFSIQGMTREDGLISGGWKLLVNHDRRDVGLYELGGDPAERYNLRLDRPEQVRRLNDALAAFLGAQLGYYGARGWESGWGPPRLP